MRPNTRLNVQPTCGDVLEFVRLNFEPRVLVRGVLDKSTRLAMDNGLYWVQIYENRIKM